MTADMQVNLTPQFDKLAQETGRNADDLVEDALVAYLDEVAQLREVLDSRFDDLKGGRVKPIHGMPRWLRLARKARCAIPNGCAERLRARA